MVCWVLKKEWLIKYMQQRIWSFDYDGFVTSPLFLLLCKHWQLNMRVLLPDMSFTLFCFKHLPTLNLLSSWGQCLQSESNISFYQYNKKTHKKQDIALNFWTFFESNVRHVCQVRDRRWRKMERETACVYLFFCFDLSCYYPLLPAVKCAAVMAPHETRRQTEGGILLSEGCDESSSLRCNCTKHSLCKQQTTKEGGRTRKTTREKEGEEKKMSVRQLEKVRETEKDWESCHHKESDSFLLFWI